MFVTWPKRSDGGKQHVAMMMNRFSRHIAGAVRQRNPTVCHQSEQMIQLYINTDHRIMPGIQNTRLLNVLLQNAREETRVVGHVLQHNLRTKVSLVLVWRVRE